MANPRHLTRAPLREALIDIQFESPVSFDLLRTFAESKGGQFGQVRDLWQASVGMNIAADGAVGTTTDRAVLGKRLDSTNPPHVLQVRTQGFTFSRLYPYESWQSMREAGLSLWDEFAAAANIQSVSRSALRYINELKLPLPIADFADYLVAPPQIPRGLPQTLAGFLQRIVIANQAAGSTGIVMQAMEGTPQGNSPQDVTVVLDIDVFRQANLPTSGGDLMACLDDLHNFKNQLFFEHLTEKALELFA